MALPLETNALIVSALDWSWFALSSDIFISSADSCLGSLVIGDSWQHLNNGVKPSLSLALNLDLPLMSKTLEKIHLKAYFTSNHREKKGLERESGFLFNYIYCNIGCPHPDMVTWDTLEIFRKFRQCVVACAHWGSGHLKTDGQTLNACNQQRNLRKVWKLTKPLTDGDTNQQQQQINPVTNPIK